MSRVLVEELTRLCWGFGYVLRFMFSEANILLSLTSSVELGGVFSALELGFIHSACATERLQFFSDKEVNLAGLERCLDVSGPGHFYGSSPRHCPPAFTRSMGFRQFRTTPAMIPLCSHGPVHCAVINMIVAAAIRVLFRVPPASIPEQKLSNRERKQPLFAPRMPKLLAVSDVEPSR